MKILKPFLTLWLFFNSSIVLGSGEITETQDIEDQNILCVGCMESFSYVLAQVFGSQITQAIFPLNEGTHKDRISLKTIDNQIISADYVPPDLPSKGVVVMYHGNAFTSKNWKQTEEYKFFRRHGLGVMMPTIRAYSNASSMDRQFNKSLLFDTEAVINYLVNDAGIPLSKIVSFGFSLGGAYAATTAHYFRTPLILQNAWQNVQSIVSENLRSIWCFDFPSIFEHYEREDYFTWNSSLRAYALKGIFFEQLVQDFGDNVRKLSLEKEREDPIDVLILYGKSDQLMNGFEGALKLYDARYPTKAQMKRRLIGLSGNHQQLFASSKIGRHSVTSFLYDNQMILREGR